MQLENKREGNLGNCKVASQGEDNTFPKDGPTIRDCAVLNWMREGREEKIQDSIP